MRDDKALHTQRCRMPMNHDFDDQDVGGRVNQ